MRVRALLLLCCAGCDPGQRALRSGDLEGACAALRGARFGNAQSFEALDRAYQGSLALRVTVTQAPEPAGLPPAESHSERPRFYRLRVEVGALPPGQRVMLEGPFVTATFSTLFAWSPPSDELWSRFFPTPTPPPSEAPPAPYVRPAPPERLIANYYREDSVGGAIDTFTRIVTLRGPRSGPYRVWVPTETPEAFRRRLAQWERTQAAQEAAHNAGLDAARAATEERNRAAQAAYQAALEQRRSALRSLASQFTVRCADARGADVSASAFRGAYLELSANSSCAWTSVAQRDNDFPHHHSPEPGRAFFTLPLRVQRGGCAWPLMLGLPMPMVGTFDQEEQSLFAYFSQRPTVPLGDFAPVADPLRFR